MKATYVVKYTKIFMKDAQRLNEQLCQVQFEDKEKAKDFKEELGIEAGKTYPTGFGCFYYVDEAEILVL
jgi:hypothetical protein